MATQSDPLFTTKAVKIDTLGEYLKQIRDQLNFDLKTVSILTQIKPTYLESLEKGDWNALPSDVYTRGFIKSLARVYNLDEQTLIEQYEKEHGFTPKARPKIETKTKLNFTPRTIIVLVSLFLGILAVGYVANQIRSVLAPPVLQLSEPNSDVNIKGNSLVIAGHAEIGADVTINEQIVLLDRNGEFTESLILSPGLNVIEVVAKNKFNKESKVTRRINAEQAQPATVVAPELPVSVTISIGPQSAWVYMEADGVVVQRGTMLAGSTKTVSAGEEILLTSANAGSTKVNYNGKDLGVMGREGEVIRNVEFTSTPLQ
jgi:transcriptional regulator with XRE-family HTH domain